MINLEKIKHDGIITRRKIPIVEIPYKITKEYFEAQNNGKIRWEKLLRPNPNKLGEKK